jgi:hypothetical protein
VILPGSSVNYETSDRNGKNFTKRASGMYRSNQNQDIVHLLLRLRTVEQDYPNVLLSMRRVSFLIMISHRPVIWHNTLQDEKPTRICFCRLPQWTSLVMQDFQVELPTEVTQVMRHVVSISDWPISSPEPRFPFLFFPQDQDGRRKIDE